VLADPLSSLAWDLAPALSMPEVPVDDHLVPTEEPSESLVVVDAGDQYEAEFIQHWSQVRYVYPWQLLLPEEEFLRRLAKRTLLYPMVKTYVVERVRAGEDDFDPTPLKQKVYVLLDTSASMARFHRFAFAKAIVLRFLEANRREMGEVFLRTFDVDVGPRQDARDQAGYDALRRRIARQHTLGNGTCLERAILTACEDIHDLRALARTEILIVTDGAARIDEGRVRSALGDRVRLHCVKLGEAQVFATDTYVDEMLEYARDTSTVLGRRIVQNRRRLEKLEQSLRDAHDESTRREFRGAIRASEAERSELAAAIRKDYAHEIERLADLFLEVPDLDAGTLFALDRERLEALERLIAVIEDRLGATPTPPEHLKQAALLLSHLALLAGEQLDPELRARLERLRDELESRLETSLEEHGHHLREGGLLSAADQRDLRVLLRRGLGPRSSLWQLLLRYYHAFLAALTGRRS
jgi:hypothetical protein